VSEPADTPPKDFPPNDWAVIRSVGELCRYDDRIWRWDGHDWQLVGPDPRRPS
jgi:hypothetical protein